MVLGTFGPQVVVEILGDLDWPWLGALSPVRDRRPKPRRMRRSSAVGEVLNYLGSQIAQTNRPLCLQVAHSWDKVALSCGLLAFQVNMRRKT